jgi:hypothetical protein
MEYIRPETVLDRFSTYLREEIRAELDDDFQEAQVGSISSTLDLMAAEIGGSGHSNHAKRQRFFDCLDELEDRLDEIDGGTTGVQSEIDVVRSSINESMTDSRFHFDDRISQSCAILLTAIDDELAGEAAKSLRRPMYEFLQYCVDGHREMLGYN